MFYSTSCDAKRYIVHHGIPIIGISGISLRRIRHILGDMAAVKVLKNALCFFFMIYNIGLINILMCAPIFEIYRYKIDDFRKHANIVCFI